MTDLRHDFEMVLQRHGAAAVGLARGLGVDGDDVAAVVGDALHELVSTHDLRGVGGEHVRVLVLASIARLASLEAPVPAPAARDLFRDLDWRMQAAVWAVEVERLPLTLVAGNLGLAAHEVEQAAIALGTTRDGGAHRGAVGIDRRERPAAPAIASAGPVLRGPKLLLYGAATTVTALVGGVLGGGLLDGPAPTERSLVEQASDLAPLASGFEATASSTPASAPPPPPPPLPEAQTPASAPEPQVLAAAAPAGRPVSRPAPVQPGPAPALPPLPAPTVHAAAPPPVETPAPAPPALEPPPPPAVEEPATEPSAPPSGVVEQVEEVVSSVTEELVAPTTLDVPSSVGGIGPG